MKCRFNTAMLPLLIATLSTTVGALAQEYPVKPIRILHQNAPGGPPETQFRALGPLVAKSLGQPFIIENRIGADGIIAAEAFVRSAPDGYTLFLTNQAVVVGNPVIREKLPYDVENFVPILLTGEFRSLVIVHPSVAAKNMQELIALARAKPGTVTWSVGSASPITTSILYVNWFKKAHGVEFLAVPYKSTTQALNAIVSGEAHLTVYADGLAANQVRSGRLRAIAAIGDQRSAAMPDVPSLKEQGIDLNVRSFYGLFALRGTPDAIVRRLNTEVRGIMDRPDFQEKYVTGLGMVYESLTPEGFAAYIRSQRADFVKLASLLELKKE